VESALTLIAIGSVLGIAAGVWMSRRMTAPLDDLAAGAAQVGAGDLAYRVTPRGSDEMIGLAQAFNHMAADLQEAEQLRQHMLADVAHELRTPLTVLQGNLRAILDDVYPLDKAEIASLYDQTRHLHRLVNDLHELAQAEAGQLPLTRHPVDVTALVADAVELFAPLAEAQVVTLTAAPAGRVLVVQADRARLMQVLQNLLTNALRHTPAGGAITVTVRAVGTQVELAVQDSGEGISAEHLPYVFDRFYRADAARDRDAGGAGLGLAIVRALVETHGGSVRVACAGPGRGSTFVVALPAVAQ
jgi:signal transduction histidine kinase